jgi:hypothetical protein
MGKLEDKKFPYSHFTLSSITFHKWLDNNYGQKLIYKFDLNFLISKKCFNDFIYRFTSDPAYVRDCYC